MKSRFTKYFPGSVIILLVLSVCFCKKASLGQDGHDSGAGSEMATVILRLKTPGDYAGSAESRALSLVEESKLETVHILASW